MGNLPAKLGSNKCLRRKILITRRDCGGRSWIGYGIHVQLYFLRPSSEMLQSLECSISVSSRLQGVSECWRNFQNAPESSRVLQWALDCTKVQIFMFGFDHPVLLVSTRTCQLNTGHDSRWGTPLDKPGDETFTGHSFPSVLAVMQFAVGRRGCWKSVRRASKQTSKFSVRATPGNGHLPSISYWMIFPKDHQLFHFHWWREMFEQSPIWTIWTTEN